jgi:topoisomerase-4 subunit A
VELEINKNEVRSVQDYAADSYLDYSMYVIQERSLPHVGDGLKPVHRRIIYSMSQLGLSHTAKHKKAARTVGDVLGKYHPHGDTACYEAMVLMSQDFSIRNPLVDGQGNWGSVDDPKSFAAMRYTEGKLTKYSDTLLSEVKQGTVDFRPNFDGSLQEPVFLPSQLPNILINGSEGIAVGISTVIPPHNMEEVVNACIAKYRNPKITHEEIMEHINGPDYPTGAEIITPKEKLSEFYEKGRGNITLRAKYEYEDGKITITELPFQVYIPKVLQEISHLVEEKKFSLISTYQDQGDQDNPVRIELVLKSKKVDPDEVMSHLFANTQLEVSRSINLTMIGLDKKPQTKSLLQVISEWTSFRQDTFERKKRFRKEKVDSRIHILEGFLIAFDILDEVIEIIRTEDEPKAVIMDRIGLSEIQAEAILEMKLRNLAKLEEYKLKSEYDELKLESNNLAELLASDRKIKNAVIKELKSVCDTHKSPRKSMLVERQEAKSISETAMISSNPVTVILSKKGWIRSAKGHQFDLSKLNYKSIDSYRTHIEMKNNGQLIVITDQGRFYTIPVHDLPSAKTVGEPITSRISLKSGDSIKYVMEHKEGSQLLMYTKNGLGFIAEASELLTKNKTGKDVHNIVSGDSAFLPMDVTNVDKIGIVTNQGRYALIDKDSINTLSKGKGVKLVNIPPKDIASGDDFIERIIPVTDTTIIKVRAGRKVHRFTKEDNEYFICNRPSRGKFFDSLKKGDINIDIESE